MWTCITRCFEELRNDREIVLAALKNNGKALKYVSIKLKQDKTIVLAALENNPNALLYDDFNDCIPIEIIQIFKKNEISSEIF